MNSLFSFEDALLALGRLTDYEKQSRFGAGYRRIGLGPIEGLLRKQSDPHRDLAVVHVAGTKGKGSTCYFLERLLLDQGLSVGLYTSPHLENLRERIRIDGELIEESAFAGSVRNILSDLALPASAPDEIRPTFFDVLTALAFCVFRERKVDAAILETGLGGRLDSTNVAAPKVTVITSIGLDHLETLGPDVESIAREKAGILKAGVPLILGVDPESGPGRVICNRADELGVEVEALGRDLWLTEDGGMEGMFEVRTKRGRYDALRLSVLGRVQRENSTLAIAATERFFEAIEGGPTLDVEAVRSGLSSVALPGRAELFCSDPPVLLDGAHNPDSARALAGVIRDELKWDRGVTMLFAMNRRASPGEVLDPLLPLVDRLVITRVRSPRSEDPETIAEYARRWEGIEVVIRDDQEEALDCALSRLDEKGRLVITGSFWAVGDARRTLRERR